MTTLTLLALALTSTRADADDVDKPEAPTPQLPNPIEDAHTYAGVGSRIAYSSQGVGEFGGSLSVALSNDLVNFSADPSIGYFMWDNLEVSGTVGYRHVTLEDHSSNQVSLLLEPSAHLPITDGLFWAVGIGGGVAFLDTSEIDLDTGIAIAPRTGIQILVGRSGLLNLGARYTAVFSDVDADLAPLGGETVLAFTNTFEGQAGYTVMF